MRSWWNPRKSSPSSQVFSQGLVRSKGTLKSTSVLMPNHLPYTHTLNVPLPLRKKVKDELKKLESLRVISEVDTTTPWCAGMVVVPRQDGTMCIWVDLKPLNAHVLRETHSLPKVDDVLAQRTGRGKDLQQVTPTVDSGKSPFPRVLAC